MLRFLFWNIKAREIERYIAQVVLEREIDFLLLAECGSPDRVLRELYNCGATSFYHHRNPVKPAVEVFSRLSLDRVISLGDYSGLTFRQILPPAGKEFLLIGAHLPSKLTMTDDDQALHCVNVANRIADFEARVGHQRTIFVGDLNMNPFERGVVAASGFHATSTRMIARRGSRVVKKERYSFFYNPMWSLWGDLDDSPPGTYFYDRSKLTEYFWHIFDQVLIRPALMGNFDNRTLEIISTIGGTNLLGLNGRPNADELSDHLPITFSLNLNPMEV